MRNSASSTIAFTTYLIQNRTPTKSFLWDLKFFVQSGGKLTICNLSVEEGQIFGCFGLKAKVELDAWLVGLAGNGSLKACWASGSGPFTGGTYSGTYTAKGFFWDDTIAFGGSFCLAGDCTNPLLDFD